MPQKKKPTTKTTARPATKRAPTAKKSVAKRVPAKATKQSQLLANDRELWLVLSWIVLIAIFLGIVIKTYVVG